MENVTYEFGSPAIQVPAEILLIATPKANHIRTRAYRRLTTPRTLFLPDPAGLGSKRRGVSSASGRYNRYDAADTKKEIEVEREESAYRCYRPAIPPSAAHPPIDTRWWSRQSGQLPPARCCDRQARHHQTAL